MESVLLLLQYGADVNALTDVRHDYRTVLHYAILSGNHETVNLLIKQGAKVNYTYEYQKPTALDLAILRGDPDLVKMMIKAGTFRIVDKYNFVVNQCLLNENVSFRVINFDEER